jgi:transcriptional regulator with XRE-family HTH domain
MSDFSALFRQIRRSNRSTFADVAKAIGVSVPEVSSIERGKVPPPTSDVIEAVGKRLQWSPAEIEALRRLAAAEGSVVTWTWKQRALYHLMSDISEAAYCAAWENDNEYNLWEMVVDPGASRDYGMVRPVSESEVDDMREIAEEIGGWIRWRDVQECESDLDTGPVFVPMAQWLPMFETWHAGRAKWRAAQGVES